MAGLPARQPGQVIRYENYMQAFTHRYTVEPVTGFIVFNTGGRNGKHIADKFAA